MLRDRQRDDWLRSMWATAFVVKAMDGAALDPVEMLPAALRPPRPPEPELTPEQERHQTQCALMLIGEALKLRN